MLPDNLVPATNIACPLFIIIFSGSSQGELIEGSRIWHSFILERGCYHLQTALSASVAIHRKMHVLIP